MKLSNKQYKKIAQEVSWYRDSAYFATLETDDLKNAYMNTLVIKELDDYAAEIYSIISCMVLNELMYRGINVYDTN